MADEVWKIFGVSETEWATAEYLGDGVYATFDGYQVWLRTSNGITASPPIALEPSVMQSLIDYAKKRDAVSV